MFSRAYECLCSSGGLLVSERNKTLALHYPISCSFKTNDGAFYSIYLIVAERSVHSHYLILYHLCRVSDLSPLSGCFLQYFVTRESEERHFATTEWTQELRSPFSSLLMSNDRTISYIFIHITIGINIMGSIARIGVGKKHGLCFTLSHKHTHTCGQGVRPLQIAGMPIKRHSRYYALDPSLTQEIIIGGTIIASVAAAFVLGFQKEPEVCPSCNGSGGVVCFACGGSGIMESDVSPEILAEARRESLGRNTRKNECRACKGVGRLLCKQCNGSGYL